MKANVGPQCRDRTRELGVTSTQSRGPQPPWKTQPTHRTAEAVKPCLCSPKGQGDSVISQSHL